MDTIDNKIADSLSRILERWAHHPSIGGPDEWITDLKTSIQDEIDWLRA